MKRVTHLLAIAAILAFCHASPASAQAARGEGGQRQGRGAGKSAPNAPGVTPGDVQKMFDAYALMQAQEQLKIPDKKFPPFLTRFKALQEIRRQTLQNRTGIIVRLRELA